VSSAGRTGQVAAAIQAEDQIADVGNFEGFLGERLLKDLAVDVVILVVVILPDIVLLVRKR
jgi:hypothetical protein